MGIIRIELRGSFGDATQEFGAMKYGHAHAVKDAICYLAGILEQSINKDHKLRDEDCQPENGFLK